MWPFDTARQSGPRYRALDPDFAISGQISVDDIPELAKAGFKTIVCARPDDEDPNQTRFATIEAAARKEGLRAIHIPVSGGLGEGQLIRIEEAVKTLPKPMLGYCRSGARAGSLFNAARSFS